MTLQLDVAVRNAMLDSFEASIGTLPTLKIWSGAVPASTVATETGTQLAALTLPSDWMSAASAGAKALLGSWQDPSADASGTAGHFRLYDSGGTCRAQGTCTATGGGGDMILDSVTFAAGQVFNITAFTLTNADT